MTHGIEQEYQKERGSRQNGQLIDRMADDEEFSDATYEQLFREASLRPAAIRRIADSLRREKQYKFDREFKVPPSLLSASNGDGLPASKGKDAKNLVKEVLAGNLSLQSDLKWESTLSAVENNFSDPFLHTRDMYILKKKVEEHVPEPAQVSATSVEVRNSLAGLLDVDARPTPTPEETAEARDRRKSNVPSGELKKIASLYQSSSPVSNKRAAGPGNTLLKIENEKDKGPLFQQKQTPPIKASEKELLEWSMIEFGTPPQPKYHEESLSKRMAGNCARADLVMNEMILNKYKIYDATVNAYLEVYAEALDIEKALEIFSNFHKFDVFHDSKSYGIMIRMFVRAKDIETAVEFKNKMDAIGLKPDSSTYGLLIKSLSHRTAMVPDSLLLLEEATAKGVEIQNKFVTQLRSRCNNLGVVHPDIPPNPLQWMVDAKKVRFEKRQSTNRRVQPVNSALYS